MDSGFRSRSHRLPAECYRGFVAAAFTICLKDRSQVITRKEIVVPCSEILIAESIRADCDVLAYTFMPDHCHILLQGNSESADTLRAVRQFKQKSGYWLSKNHGEIQWHKSFYDRILRTSGERDIQIRYILENPVRKNIIGDWKEYPWKGSTVYDLNEWCA